MNCQICDYAINKTVRKEISCPYCEFSACKTCCETYILNESTVKCMSPACGREWTRQYISNAFTAGFINGKLKKHKEQVLFDSERALLPATQPIVERQIKLENLAIEQANIRQQMRELQNKKTQVQLQIWNIQSNRTPVERTEFVKPCPDTECRGFLSTQWKCGLCQKWSCPHCHEIKGLERDVAHECNPETVATVSLLANDTKPCPSCHTQIFRVSGCFAKDTNIKLWNGSVKYSQDICVGDILIGDDGNERIVERIVSGEDELYEISQSNGDSYTVNSKHTLALKFKGTNPIIWSESLKVWTVIWFDRSELKIKSKKFRCKTNKCDAERDAKEYYKNLNLDEIILLTVDQYLKLDDRSKNSLFGYKSSNGINYKAQDLSLDPYMLGLWLGDGTHTHPIIASNDKEIEDYIVSWCSQNDAEVVKDGRFKYRIRRKGQHYGKETVDNVKYSETRAVKHKSNPFLDVLKKYNLIKNKHIPIEFMMNSRENRLKLLAGIIDTDGHVPKNECGKRAVIIQSNKILSKQIIELSRSLGFTVNYRISQSKQKVIFGRSPKDYSDMYVINISGKQLYEIPTILPRKKCYGNMPNKDYLKSKIHVRSIGRGNYYGWTLNNNHRFIMEDFTVVKNCDDMFCTNCHTGFNWRTGRAQQTLHNPHYFEWLRRNGGQIPRTPGDAPCRQELTHATYTNIRRLIQDKHTCSPMVDNCIRFIEKLIRNALHMRYVIVPSYEHGGRFQRNEQLRIMYMRNQITEDHFKTVLQRDQKKSEKMREIHNILDLLLTTVTDIVFRFWEHLNVASNGGFNMTILNEVEPIVKYANECLLDVSITYKSKLVQFKSDLGE